jgi:hypothetical protein
VAFLIYRWVFTLPGILKLDFSVLLLCALCVSVVSPAFSPPQLRLCVRRSRGRGGRIVDCGLAGACCNATGSATVGATGRGESHDRESKAKSQDVWRQKVVNSSLWDAMRLMRRAEKMRGVVAADGRRLEKPNQPSLFLILSAFISVHLTSTSSVESRQYLPEFGAQN